MSSRDITIYECDFCSIFVKQRNKGVERNITYSYATTEYPEIQRWFYLPEFKSHACVDCGHKLHELLGILEIEHKFICTQYSDKPEMGEIRFND